MPGGSSPLRAHSARGRGGQTPRCAQPAPNVVRFNQVDERRVPRRERPAPRNSLVRDTVKPLVIRDWRRGRIRSPLDNTMRPSRMSARPALQARSQRPLTIWSAVRSRRRAGCGKPSLVPHAATGTAPLVALARRRRAATRAPLAVCPVADGRRADPRRPRRRGRSAGWRRARLAAVREPACFCLTDETDLCKFAVTSLCA